MPTTAPPRAGGHPHTPYDDVKTALRGVSHAYACFAALAAGIMLVLSAPHKREKVACAIYVGARFVRPGDVLAGG